MEFRPHLTRPARRTARHSRGAWRNRDRSQADFPQKLLPFHPDKDGRGDTHRHSHAKSTRARPAALRGESPDECCMRDLCLCSCSRRALAQRPLVCTPAATCVCLIHAVGKIRFSTHLQNPVQLPAHPQFCSVPTKPFAKHVVQPASTSRFRHTCLEEHFEEAWAATPD